MKKSTVDKSGARPFLKWVGGKGQLLPELVSRMPPSYGRYFEPFLGGGALFFHLRPRRATLSDINEELINVYRAVKFQVDDLVNALSYHVYDKEYFYELRNVDRDEEYFEWDSVDRAARFIYLNKTCYNGLYRVNSRGEFNAPFGRYKNPAICNRDLLASCSAALSRIKIVRQSYTKVIRQAQRGDFVYFDPPYAPLSASSNFTSYVKEGFSGEDQRELRDLCKALDKIGIKWMVSNSSAPLILRLYKSYNIEFVDASRAVNSKASKRGKVKEVIVRNY